MSEPLARLSIIILYRIKGLARPNVKVLRTRERQVIFKYAQQKASKIKKQDQTNSSQVL